MRFEIVHRDRHGRHLHSENVYCEHNGTLPDRPRIYCEETTVRFVGRTEYAEAKPAKPKHCHTCTCNQEAL